MCNARVTLQRYRTVSYLYTQTDKVFSIGMELKVANMSSPLIRENRHSEVDIKVCKVKDKPSTEYHLMAISQQYCYALPGI